MPLLFFFHRFRETKTVRGTETTWAEFSDLSLENEYAFELRSRNSLDYSLKSSHVLLPAAAKSKSLQHVELKLGTGIIYLFICTLILKFEWILFLVVQRISNLKSNSIRFQISVPSRVENVIKICYNDTLFEVQWSPSSTSPIDSYTVFWCHSIRENPVRCQGQLHAVGVGPESTSTSITVPDARSNYQFGVSANGGDGGATSGIVWSSCIINANGPNSQIKNVHVSYVTASKIGVSWSLPCTPQYGIITSYNIYYCSVDDMLDADCLGNHIC